MSLTKNRTLEIPLKPESYETADQFIKQWLIQKRISDESSFETMLLFEALFHDMIEQGCGQDTILTIKAQKTSANIRSISALRANPISRA